MIAPRSTRETRVLGASESRRLVMLVARSSSGDVPLGRQARSFGGYVEALGGGSKSAVVWRSAWSVESAVRMAVALHREVDDARIGVVAVLHGGHRAMAEVHSRAFELVHALSTMASPGSTLLSAQTHAVPPSVRYEVYGLLFPDVALEPVSVLRVTSVAPQAERSRDRIVGRDAEISEFRRLVASVADSGRGLVLRVQGEAGIGKTHLLDELQRIAAEHGFSCHRAFNLEHEVSRSRSAIATLVRSLLEHGTLDDEPGWIDSAFAQGRIEAEHVPFIRDVLDRSMTMSERGLFEAMAPELRARRRIDALQALVRGAVRRGPLLLDVEDVHWASEETRTMLRAIVSVVGEHPIVLALTSRTGSPRPLGLEVGGGPPVHRWLLQHLAPGDAEAMAAAVLSGRRAPWMMSSSRYVGAEVVARCVERSGGHPLVLEQMLINRGVDIDPESPTSIVSLVEARLRTLEPEERRAVRVAAACGARFDVAVVSKALGRQAWDVTAAMRAGLVVEEGREHRFTHGMVRDAVYAAIEEEPRRRIHRALAEVMTHPKPRAEHLERAGDPAAAQAHLEAAQKEDEAGRSASARIHVERGLGVARDDDEVKIGLHALSGQIHVGWGRPEPAIVAFEQMYALARSPLQRCRARLGMVSALRLQSRSDDAEAPLAEAEALAADEGRDALIAQAAFYRGCLHFAHGDVERCLEEHERAVNHARRAKDPRTEALALSGLGDAHYARSRIGRALGVLERCIVLCRQHGFGRIEVGNLFMMGAFRILENDVVAAVRDCIEAAQMAARVGNRRAQMLASLNVGIGLTHRGDTQAALDWISTATQIAEQMDSPIFLGSCWAFEARALTVGGMSRRGLERGRAALEISREGNMRFFGGVALGVVARATDSVAERRDALDEGEHLLAQGCVSHNYFYFYEDALETSLTSGRWDEVERFARAFDTVDAAEPIARCRLLVERARVLASRGRGETDEAVLEAVRAVLGRARAVGLQPLIPALERALGATGVRPA